MGDGELPSTRGVHKMVIGRRRALAVIGGVAAGVALAPRSALAVPVRIVPPATAPDLAFQVIRVEDMLYLGFQFYNAKMVVKNGQTYIAVADTSQPAYVVVVFPPQHHGEEVYDLRNAPSDWPPTPPLHDALAGSSWLAFELPAHASIPFTAAGLLAWDGLTPQLVPVVSDPAAGAPAAPDPLHSALEVPWSLWLSPPAGGTWHHSATPVTASGYTELWHTRLGVGGAEPPGVTPQITAFWSATYGSAGTTGQLPSDPWQMSLFPEARNDIVALSCSVVAGGGPAQASLLALSALGASLNVQGAWSPGSDSGVSLAQWTHRASTGRDSYVRVVFLGYLFPFGHRAVRVEVTDREFWNDYAGDTGAYLVTRSYITVTQPVITYTGDPYEPYSGRGNPIRSVEVKTVSTETSYNAQAQVGDLSTEFVTWICNNSLDVPFSFVATDVEGRTIDFTTPAIWLDQTYTGQAGTIAAAYDAAGAARNTPSFGGGLFAFADTSGAAPGSTAHHVDTYTLTASAVSTSTASTGSKPAKSAVSLPTASAAGFYPMLNSAGVHLPGPEQLSASSLAATSVSIAQNYLDSGFQAGVTEIYLQVAQVANNVPSLSFPVNLVGGMAAPNFDVTGIARDLGPVGGNLTKLLNGTFDPSDYFGMLSGSSGGVGKLLGAIPITDIIALVDPDGPAASAQAPQLTYNLVYPGGDDTKLPVALDAKLTWNPMVKADSAGFFQPGGNAKLLITAEIYAPISNPAQSSYTIHGELRDFTLVLFGSATPFIGIQFTSFTFDSKTGAKTSVNPRIAAVTFMGALSFIQDLEQLLGSLDGPSIAVTAAGIAASYTLALPDVTVGVFSLSNLSLTGAVNIPFDGTPVRVRFALCSQDDPFLLTIYLFGGGGFFSLAIGADGIEEIQVSLEFGAAISIDLGVASGSVSIMAGIYFSLQTFPSEQVNLTGFLRADGNLSVLGIITLSMEFYLGFTYLDPGQAYGEATVTVSISVLFFSKSVSATMKKTIGGGSDPDFAQAISMADWDIYCEAFA
jgi:hypothetical protein